MKPIKISKENNFTIVRYFLAINIFIGHFNVLNDSTIPRLTSGFVNIGAFFCISGFFALITYKEGMGIMPFLKKRAKRLIPPYATVVILSALLLGFTSTLSLKEYFSSAELYKYLTANLCYLNFLQRTLPGVFSDNIYPFINGSLWYMKVEWMLTLSIPLVIYLKNKLKIKLETILIFIIILSSLWRLYFIHLINIGEMSSEQGLTLIKQFPGELIYFYTGTLLYLSYSKIKNHPYLSALTFLLLSLLTSIIPYSEALLTPISVSCLVIWVSIIGKWGFKITKQINISYGLYLTHYPIIQLLYHLLTQYQLITSLYIRFTLALILTWSTSFCIWLLFDYRYKKNKQKVKQPVK